MGKRLCGVAQSGSCTISTVAATRLRTELAPYPCSGLLQPASTGAVPQGTVPVLPAAATASAVTASASAGAVPSGTVPVLPESRPTVRWGSLAAALPAAETDESMDAALRHLARDSTP